jgi:8-oxo-dGTP pyrophosphatase MutT (NUDIX family)
MSKRITGRGIVIRDGQILLMERWRGSLHYFSIPGGGVEEGETPETAARREIYEETGLRVTVGRKYITAVSRDAEHHIFLCGYLSGEPHLPQDSPEALEHALGHNRFKPRWIPIEEVKNLRFEYWEPLRSVICEGIEKGFSGPEKAVTF